MSPVHKEQGRSSCLFQVAQSSIEPNHITCEIAKAWSGACYNEQVASIFEIMIRNACNGKDCV